MLFNSWRDRIIGGFRWEFKSYFAEMSIQRKEAWKRKGRKGKDLWFLQFLQGTVLDFGKYPTSFFVPISGGKKYSIYNIPQHSFLCNLVY